ncbi:unnamed protein product [Caenorhabditis bovis]|uniref:RNA helicase n=1 Tax=Caenorhabditis bovis TaxID=2654633 RepID=A0A8S1EXK2_9PELO|nr:unnamed protein product [Caenorhabditis bovis]
MVLTYSVSTIEAAPKIDSSLEFLFAKVMKKQEASRLHTLMELINRASPAGVEAAVPFFAEYETFRSDKSANFLNDGNGHVVFRQYRRARLSDVMTLSHAEKKLETLEDLFTNIQKKHEEVKQRQLFGYINRAVPYGIDPAEPAKAEYETFKSDKSANFLSDGNGHVKMSLRLIEADPEVDGRKSIESEIKKRKGDDQFEGMREIVRNLYSIPREHLELSEEETRVLQSAGGIMKVYPFHEDSKVRVPAPVESFEQAFGKNDELMKVINKAGFDKPTPIQAQMWPILLSGIDCIGVSQTGSGKTLAFLLPAFLHIDAQYKLYGPNEKKPCPSVLVLSPTRELAQQIEGEVQKYSYNGYKSICLYGGSSRREQVDGCKDGVEIVIATPGRLADLSAEGVICLKTVSYVVLDEADRMLDMGFEVSIRRILFEIRPDRLVALTSATWPESVRSLTDRYTKDGVMAVNGSLDLTSCKSVTQYFEFIRPEDRFERLCEIIAHLNKTLGKNFKLIIFVKAKVMADHVSSEFCMKGISSQGLHGGRSQTDRENSLRNLRNGSVQILVATDLASRGIDVPDITHVINYDFPNDIEEYVHRVGRTGRAGKRGEALSFLWWSDRSNFKPLISILEKSGQSVPDKLISEQRRYEHKLQMGTDKPRQPFRYRKNDNFQTNY